VNITGRALSIGGTTVWNVSIVHTNLGNITYFNGSVDGLLLGSLSLGGQGQTQFFGKSNKAGDNVTFNL
jgi:hypothetical protein